MESLETMIITLLRDHNVSEDAIFELVNRTLLKHRKKNNSTMLHKKKDTKRKRRRIVCRPVLLISDSSDND
jgi:hypothetical protein